MGQRRYISLEALEKAGIPFRSEERMCYMREISRTVISIQLKGIWILGHYSSCFGYWDMGPDSQNHWIKLELERLNVPLSSI